MLSRILCSVSHFQVKRRIRRWARFKPPAYEENRLTLRHIEFGYKQFEVESADFNVYEGPDEIWEFVIQVFAAETVRQSHELEEVPDGSLGFEATALLPVDNHDIYAGRTIHQPQGYDYLRGINLSNFSYLRQGCVEELQVEIQSVTQDSIHARVSGSSVVNGSLYSHPDARFCVEADFVRSNELRRGIR